MSFAIEYNAANAIRLINKSEGSSLSNGARKPDTEHGGHAIGRHLVQTFSGGNYNSAPYERFRNRFVNNPINSDGTAMLSSAWAGKGDMALLLCELLNSKIGQLALAKLDNTIPRIFIHYLNEQRLRALYGNLHMLESRVAVTPESTVTVNEDIYNKKTNEFIKTLTKTVKIPRSADGKVKPQLIASMNALLTTDGKSLHLQTFFPSTDASSSYAEWSTGDVKNASAFGTDGIVYSKATST